MGGWPIFFAYSAHRAVLALHVGISYGRQDGKKRAGTVCWFDREPCVHARWTVCELALHSVCP